MKKKLFKNKTDWMVLAFVVLVLGMMGYCEDAAADISIEYYHDSNAGTSSWNAGFDRIGGRYTYDTGASVYLAPLASVGGRSFDKGGFEFGLGDKLWGRWEGQLQFAYVKEETFGGFSIRRVVGDGPFQLSIGGSYWMDRSPGSDSSFTFNLGIRYTL